MSTSAFPQQQQHGGAAAPDNASTTHFGFKDVPEAEKEHLVGNVFRNVADKYDVMNDVMSAGIHRLWKDELVYSMLRPAPGMAFLDLAGGTGDIAFRILDAVTGRQRPEPLSEVLQGAGNAATGAAAAVSRFLPASAQSLLSQVIPSSCQRAPSVSGHATTAPHVSDANVTVLASEQLSPSATRNTGPATRVVVSDINGEMLRVGREQAAARGLPYNDTTNPRLEWLEANAEAIPVPDSTFDAVTISFGLRNCTHIDAVLREVYRVLRPGGRFLCLEFSTPPNPLVQQVYDAYSFTMIPVMGQVIANDWDSYQYLVESIRKFPKQPELADIMRQAGFKHVAWSDMTMGVTSVHSGYRDA